MNYRVLFKGLTVKQFNEIAENWYARLNSLKDYYTLNPNNEKVLPLISEMVARMTIISQLYIQINRPAPPKKEFMKGGVVQRKS